MTPAILVPVDGSSLSETALNMAIPIARGTQAAVEALIVHESPPRPAETSGAPARDPRFDDDQRAGVVAYTNDLARRLATRAPELTTRVILREGPPAGTIAGHVREGGHSLVVMTTHGRSGPSRLWLGSVADRVIRTSPVPVLLLTELSSASPVAGTPLFEHVVVPIDTGDGSEDILASAVALAGAAATYHLIHVVTPLRLLPLPGFDVAIAVDAKDTRPADVLGVARDAAERHLGRLAERMRHDRLRVTTRVQIHERPAEAIIAHAVEARAGLIAMSSHGRGMAGRLLLGGVTDKVVRGGTFPVLVRVPPAAARQGP